PSAPGFALVITGLLVWIAMTPAEAPTVEASNIEQTAKQFRAEFPSMPSRARLLFLSDSFDPRGYSLFYTMRLLYGSQDIQVDRLTEMQAPSRKGGDPQAYARGLPHYDHIFTHDGKEYVELDNRDTERTIQLRLLKGQSLEDHVAFTDINAAPY